MSSPLRVPPPGLEIPAAHSRKLPLSGQGTARTRSDFSFSWFRVYLITGQHCSTGSDGRRTRDRLFFSRGGAPQQQGFREVRDSSPRGPQWGAEPPRPPSVPHALLPCCSGILSSTPRALGAVVPSRCASAAAAEGHAPEGPGSGRRARERLERYHAERQRFMKYDIMQHANLEPALSKDPKAPIAVKITMRRFKHVEHGS